MEFQETERFKLLLENRINRRIPNYLDILRLT